MRAVLMAWSAAATLAAADLAMPNQVRAWQAALLEAQSQVAAVGTNSAELAGRLSSRLEREAPVPWDWCLQDAGTDFRPWLSPATQVAAVRQALGRVVAEIGEAGRGLQAELDQLEGQSPAAEPGRWLELYARAAESRRTERLRNLRRQYPRWVFTKHHTLGGSHYAYTEGQSDAQDERHFDPQATLCQLQLDPRSPEVRVLLDDRAGVIRDPDVSWDGQRVLFAWKQSDRDDDYHLYELILATGAVKQLTHGLGFADYEGVYLPNDDLLFNSTRPVQTVDCWWTEVSNLYTCAPDGRFLRRLTFDQVHDNYPTVLPDGRIIYTRWEYNDRGQIFVQGLFQMNPDGTGQTEFYGNNSWFPTSLLHARGIPGSRRVVAVFSGHHTLQTGKLGLVDPALGRQENTGTRLLAPVREPVAGRVDMYGQGGELFQYPYPLSESEFVVAYTPLGWRRSPTLFKLYWVAADGRRELLVADPDISCNQPVPLAARSPRPVRPSLVDHRQTKGTCYLQDVYRGPGLAGVARGTVKRLRVIGLDYRAAGIGLNYNTGAAGSALCSTPVSLGNGSWDVKTVLGETIVHPDGSAWFHLPARTPVYFQPIDDHGYAVQTMRSWVTVQPGEQVACVGCHEPKNSAPPAEGRPSLASRAGPQDLVPFHGPPRGFSFPREIQPILDRQCVRCHKDEQQWEARLGRRGGPSPSSPARTARAKNLAFSLLGTPIREGLAKRQWSASYLALVQGTEQTLEGQRYLAGTPTALVQWVSAQSEPPMLPPYSVGAARSGLLRMLTEGHHRVRLARSDLEKLACWIDLAVPFCGDYQEAHLWAPEDQDKYRRFLDKRRAMQETERRNIADWMGAGTPPFRPTDSPQTLEVRSAPD